jgi:hypothetical protein
MSFKAVLAFAAALIMVTLAPTGCDDDIAGDVRAVYEDVDAATKNRDSATMLRLIDPKNIENASRLMEVARTGTGERIQVMSSIERLHVARMRNRLTKDQLKSFDGRAYLQHACSQGWMAGNPTGITLSLGKVTYDAPRAYAKVFANGEETTIRLEFVRVDGQWLVDMDGMNDWYNTTIERMAARSNGTENGIILAMESRASGKQVGVSIWAAPPK